MADVMEMLALSPTMDEGVLAEWHKQEGDSVDEGEVIADVETDKATMEMESFHSGTVLKILADAGSTVEVGAPLIVIGEEGEDISDLLDGLEDGKAAEAAGAPEPEETEPEPAPEEDEKPAAAAGKAGDERLKASPLARRMAEDKGLDLHRIDGSGPGGRIIKRDIEAAEKAPPKRAAAAPEGLVGADVSYVPGEAEPLNQMRKAIAERMTGVWQTTPHFYLTRQIDMGPIMSHRKSVNDQLADSQSDLKISVNDLIVKAAAAALAAYPRMNVAFTDEGTYRFDEINIGVAVAIEEGLITPTVRNADEKSVGSIAREIRELAGRAREGKLAPEEYSAHTFSVSNLGMYDIDEFMAVINPPDAAILACGAVKDVPVVEDGELTVGTRMKVTLACDHRVVDGAVGAEFLQELVRFLEHPMMLLV